MPAPWDSASGASTARDTIWKVAPLRGLFTGAVFCAAAFAQTALPPKKAPREDSLGGNATFRAGVETVLVPVVVRDSAGHPIGGLTAGDFQLFDKGKRQKIDSFTVLRHAGVENGPATVSTSGPADPFAGNGSLRPAAAPQPGGTPSQDRYIAYVFDDRNTLFGSLVAMRQAAVRYFEEGIPQHGSAAIYTFSGRNTLDFTNDAAKLKADAAAIGASLAPGHGDPAPCPNATYYLADLIVHQNDTQALEAVTRQTMDCMHVSYFVARNLAEAAARREIVTGEQDTHVWVTTLRRVINVLEACNGERLLVLASSGFFAQTSEGRKALADTLDMAARAHVTISTLDARGVYLPAPMDAARSDVPGNLERHYYEADARVNGDVLSALAEGTGGSFLRNHNDLTKGFEQLASPPEFSYVLGFSPGALKEDGSFHALKIRLPGRGGLTIQARSGYFAPGKKGQRAEQTSSEIDEAVLAHDEITAMPVESAAQVSRSGNAPAKLLVVTKAHVKTFPFQKMDGRNHDVLTVVSVIYDDQGGYVVGARNTMNLMFRDETLAGKRDPAVNVQSDFALNRPGRYRLRIVVFEDAGEMLSARNVTIVVP